MQAAVAEQLHFSSSPEKPTRRKYAKLTKEKQQAIVDMAESNPNLSHTAIATLEDCERSTVSKVLAKYGIDKAELEDFKINRADIYAGFQKKCLSFITDDKLKNTSPAQLMLMACQSFDKERLERGQSTENVSLLVGAIQELQARKRGQFCG